VRDAFNCCLCLLMAEAGKARLVEMVPGEPVPRPAAVQGGLADRPGNGTVCVFESLAGERFSLARPPMTEETEAAVRVMLNRILREYSLSLPQV